VFEVRKSIRRFREDPAWTYEKRSRAPYAQFDNRGYPFSLAGRTRIATDFLRGSVAGHPVTLFQLDTDYATGGRGGFVMKYSVAVLELPRALPATAVTTGRLLRHARHSWQTPLPPGTWEQHPLPGGGPGAQVQRVSEDYEFGEAAVTEEVKRLTAEAELGWRIEGNRLIGWAEGRRTYEEIIVLAERLAAIYAAFPPAVRQWPAGA
jgi:hypothetical protein